MLTLPLWTEAQVHRETAIAITRKAIPNHGDQILYAKLIGITHQYIRHVLSPDDDHFASEEVAKKIAHTLPLETWERKVLEEHLMIAHECKYKAKKMVQSAIHSGSCSDGLYVVEQSFRIASQTAAPTFVGAVYKELLEQCETLLPSINPFKEAFLFAHISLLFHNALRVVGRPIPALYKVKIARYLLEPV